MAVTQTIKIDLNNHKADDIIIRVGESYTRKIVFIPGTYEGDEFKPIEFYGREAGPRALFRLVKPDRTFVMLDLTAVLEEPDTGFYSFELIPDEYMSQVAGIGYYDIRINDSDTEEEFLYTVQGRVLIDDDMITAEMLESIAAVNGLVFPDDFLTSADLSNYATKEYVDDAIAEIPDPLHNYSETEQEIGKWIDGKPLYEITLNYNSATVNTWVNHDLSALHIAMCYIAGGYCNRLSSGVNIIHPFNYYEPGSGNYLFTARYNVENKSLDTYVKSMTGNTTDKQVIILRYTKTTD